jgi:hypothetical protein
MGLFQAFNWLADRVGDGVRAVGDVAGDVLRPIGDVAGDAIKGIGNAVVKVVDYGADTVRAIAKDPLPTLLAYAGMAVGIPPYITSAVITAARGGNLEDIAKSAAISYATTSFMSNTQIGADIQNYTTNSWAGDFTDSMVQNFDLPLDTAMQVYKVASSTLNSSLTGGINAALTGKSVAEGISSGFVSGLAYSGTNSYFDSVNKDPSWGFSPKALELMKGATTTALNTAILGKKDANGKLIDPAQAVGNYIAYAGLNMAGSELYKKANNAYDNFTKATTDVDKAGSKYSVADEQYKTKLKESEVLRVAINNDSSAYQKIIDEKYTPFKTKYEDLISEHGKEVANYNATKDYYNFTPTETLAQDLTIYANRANALSDQANKLYADNKSMLNELTTQSAAINNNVEKFSAIKDDIGAPAGSIHEDNSFFAKLNSNIRGTPLAIIDDRNTAQKLKDASDAYQARYDAWSATKATADQSAETYTKALAEVATRDATVDALNSGVITSTQKDADGNYILSNGMTLNKDGTFFQDGVQQFTNAVGINQRPLDLTRMDGGQTAALGNGQVTATTPEATPLIPLEEAPPLPDNTVTEVLTNAGLVDGAKDDNTLGGLGLSVPKNTPLGDLSSPINEGTVTDLRPSDMGGGTGLLSTGDVALPSLPSMGGGSGLSVPTNTIIGDKDSPINDPDVLANVVPGTVTEAGVTAPDKSVPLGDPNSFINTGTLPKLVTPVTPKTPVVPKTPTTPVKPTTPAAVTPAAVTPAAVTPAATEEASRTDNLVDEILGFDVSAKFDPLWLLKDRTQANTTKIASGGYLDDLLADPTSFNDLLRILRS